MPERERSRIFAPHWILRMTVTCERTFRSHQTPEGVGFAAATKSTLGARVSVT